MRRGRGSSRCVIAEAQPQRHIEPGASAITARQAQIGSSIVEPDIDHEDGGGLADHREPAQPHQRVEAHVAFGYGGCPWWPDRSWRQCMLSCNRLNYVQLTRDIAARFDRPGAYDAPLIGRDRPAGLAHGRAVGHISGSTGSLDRRARPTRHCRRPAGQDLPDHTGGRRHFVCARRPARSPASWAATAPARPRPSR